MKVKKLILMLALLDPNSAWTQDWCHDSSSSDSISVCGHGQTAEEALLSAKATFQALCQDSDRCLSSSHAVEVKRASCDPSTREIEFKCVRLITYHLTKMDIPDWELKERRSQSERALMVMQQNLRDAKQEEERRVRDEKAKIEQEKYLAGINAEREALVTKFNAEMDSMINESNRKYAEATKALNAAYQKASPQAKRELLRSMMGQQ